MEEAAHGTIAVGEAPGVVHSGQGLVRLVGQDQRGWLLKDGPTGETGLPSLVVIAMGMDHEG